VAAFARHRAGKGPIDVAKELKFDQLAEEFRAIDRNQRASEEWSANVNLAGDDPFADSGLAFVQHRGKSGSDGFSAE
jgi:hypothetical protein